LDDATTRMLDNEEREDGPEERVVQLHEVACPDLLFVRSQERCAG
jgi:hypothetical protein